MRYFISLSYCGTGFSGWQIQPNAPSVEEELEKGLTLLLGHPVDVVGAGRTDAGVHASSFVAHFDFPHFDLSDQTDRLCYKLNAILHPGISIHHIGAIHDQAHARFDATSRQYLYFIHLQKNPFIASHSWYCKYDLDFDRMNQAAQRLLGRRDFSCFEKVNGGNATSICELTEAIWKPCIPSLDQLGTPKHDLAQSLPNSEKYPYFVFSIRGNRFLRNMVRAIVGSLIEIGRGKQAPKWIDELLQEGNRSSAGQSVPGHALFLSDITYPYPLPWEKK